MKNPIRILAFLAIAACLAFALPQPEKKQINVVIDSGHGGKDHGSIFNGLTEKEIVSQVTSKIKALHKNSEVTLHFTRETDEFVTLEERVAAINEYNPDLVVSLHLNYSKDADIYGMEFFVTNTTESDKSLQYAQVLAKKFTDKEYTNRGVKQAPMYILKNSKVPAIIFEAGYLSNETDRLYLTSESGQNEIAGTLLEFIGEIK